jgi:hypothetical protein
MADLHSDDTSYVARKTGCEHQIKDIAGSVNQSLQSSRNLDLLLEATVFLLLYAASSAF